MLVRLKTDTGRSDSTLRLVSRSVKKDAEQKCNITYFVCYSDG